MVAPVTPTRAVVTAAESLLPDCSSDELSALANVNPRTARRLLAAAKGGDDIPAARGVAAALHDRLSLALALLEPFKREPL
jgi:hypothetical protein